MNLSPASPKSVFPGLAEAIAPATEETAKLKVIEREALQIQPSCRSPVCHQLQLNHSQVIIQSFTGLFFKVLKPQRSAHAAKVATRASSSGLQQSEHLYF